MKSTRIEIEFTKDYADFKKGESLITGRSLAHELITVNKVAKIKKAKEAK